MDRRTYPLTDDSSHQGMAFRPASSTERDEYLKTFPNPMPSTHYLHWAWDSESGELRFEVRVKPEAKAAGDKSSTIRPTAPGTDERRRELTAMTNADLLALAAEEGADVDPKSSKALIVAAIIEQESKPAGK